MPLEAKKGKSPQKQTVDSILIEPSGKQSKASIQAL